MMPRDPIRLALAIAAVVAVWWLWDARPLRDLHRIFRAERRSGWAALIIIVAVIGGARAVWRLLQAR